jgi:type II secretory pathway component HofQ
MARRFYLAPAMASARSATLVTLKRPRSPLGSLLGLLLALAAAASPSTAAARDPGVIDLDVVGADVRNVIRLLADVGHVNVVYGDDVAGQVTMHLKAVHWRAALDAVLAVKGLAAQSQGNVLVIRVSR